MISNDELYRVLLWRPPSGTSINPAWNAWAEDMLCSLAGDDVDHLAAYATRVLRVQESRFPGALPPLDDVGIPWPELRCTLGWGLDHIWHDVVERDDLLVAGIQLAARNGWVVENTLCYALTISGRNEADHERSPVAMFYLPTDGELPPDPRMAKRTRTGKPRGRPQEHNPDEDERLYFAWKQARAAGVKIQEFCDDHDIARGKLQSAFDRYRKWRDRNERKRREG